MEGKRPYITARKWRESSSPRSSNLGSFEIQTAEALAGNKLFADVSQDPAYKALSGLV